MADVNMHACNVTSNILLWCILNCYNAPTVCVHCVLATVLIAHTYAHTVVDELVLVVLMHVRLLVRDVRCVQLNCTYHGHR